MTNLHRQELETELARIPNQQAREVIEMAADFFEWNSNECHFHEERTEFGRHFEHFFETALIPALKIIEDGNIEVYTNFDRPGCDAYVHLIKTDTWIPIELKNWHTTQVTPGMADYNFFERKPYVKLSDGRTVKLQEKDIAARILAFSNKQHIQDKVMAKAKETNTTIVQGDGCFESRSALTSENVSFLIDLLVRLIHMIKSLTGSPIDSAYILSSVQGYISGSNMVPVGQSLTPTTLKHIFEPVTDPPI